MGEPALKLVETIEEKALTAVDQRALSYVEKTKTLPPITTNDDYLCVGEIWKTGKELLKELDNHYDDLIKDAHLLHKKAVAKKAIFYVPTEAGVKAAKKLLSDYDEAQERLRKAEEERLAAIVRKQAEEDVLLAAIAAEEEAKRNGATQEEAAQESAAIINEPVYVPPVVVQKAVPKMAGGPIYRTITKFEVVNADLIPRKYMIPDMAKIGGVARALKGHANIPGVKVYEERV